MTNQSAVLSEFFDENIIDGKFNATQWPSKVVSILIRYLAMMYEAESSHPTENPFDRLQYDRSDDDYWVAVRSVLEPNMATYNITIDQLKASLQNELSIVPFNYTYTQNCLYQYQFIADLFEQSYISGCFPTELISYIDGQSICSRLFGFELGLNLVGSNLIFPFNLYFVPASSPNGTIFSNINQPYTLDFTGRSTPPPKS